MAGMYFRYGGYSHPVGEVRVEGYDEDAVIDDRGIVTSTVVTMGLVGTIVANGDVAIDARVAEIQNAYSMDGYDAALILSNGQPSHIAMYNAGSLYGVQVTKKSIRIDPNRAHFATGLPFSITLKAEYGIKGIQNPLLGSSESIEQIGDGGPITIITVLDNGQPIGDTVSPASPVIVTQSGERTFEVPTSLGITYPNANPPLFPGNMIRPDGYRISRSKGRSRDAGKTQYITSWNYTFHFTTPPFIPNPNA